MQSSEPPPSRPVLYKFYSHESFYKHHKIVALQDGTLAFTPPNHFNDPFEFLPEIVSDSRASKLRQKAGIFTKKKKERLRRGYNLEHGTSQTKADFNSLVARNRDIIADQVPQKLESFPWEMASRMIEIVSNDFGILCMSKNWSHPLMWGHYAGGFRGFCVGYEMPLDADCRGLSCVEIKYSRERYPLNEVNVLEGKISRELVDGIVRTKSVHWSYEEEVRFIIDISSPALTPKPNRKQFYLRHPPEAVHEIIIGMRCGEKFRKSLKKLRDDQYPHAELFDTVPCSSALEVERRLLM
jgi:hypothetical protein